MKSLLRALACCLLLLPPGVFAQTPAPVTPFGQAAAVERIDSLLRRSYVFPEMAGRMADLLQQKLKAGDYAPLTDPLRFAERLTEDLQSLSHDKHLRVRFNPDLVRDLRAPRTGGGEEATRAQREQQRMGNYGFREVKLLEGNIGYLDLRGFVHTDQGKETAVAAMNFLSNANALIIDLRRNGGGSPTMIQLISSYLFGPEPVHLNSFYFRPSNSNTETWTLAEVSGKRRPDMDVYVLTSKATFSAAEEFTYNLQNLKRATIIGETTGGGAHPGGEEVVNDYLTIFIPVGRAINPITKTNWEGKGVLPDMAVPAADALAVARQQALERLVVRDSANPRSIYPWLLAAAKAKRSAPRPDETALREYTGVYGGSAVTLEGGSLYYPVSKSAQAALIPLEPDLFEVAETLQRVRFVREGGKITGIRIERPGSNSGLLPRAPKSM